MEQRDYLKDQIEQMGKVLAELMGKFMGFKSKGQTSQGIEYVQTELKSQLDIDLDDLLALEKNELKEYLLTKHFSAEHIEQLSDILRNTGEIKLSDNKDEARDKLEKALQILEIADEISNAASFSRISQKTEIENLLMKIK